MAANQDQDRDRFEQAFQWLLQDEGGYVDDPNDHGGPTKYGITQRAWAMYLNRAVTEEDVRNITVAEARKFYRVVFWGPLRADQIAVSRPAVAAAVFNVSVLCGTPRTVRLVQSCLGVDADGIIGPRTCEAILRLSEAQFFLRFVPAVALRLVDLVDVDPQQSPFLKGWMHRVMRLLQLLDA